MWAALGGILGGAMVSMILWYISPNIDPLRDKRKESISETKAQRAVANARRASLYASNELSFVSDALVRMALLIMASALFVVGAGLLVGATIAVVSLESPSNSLIVFQAVGGFAMASGGYYVVVTSQRILRDWSGMREANLAELESKMQELEREIDREDGKPE